MKKGFLFFLFIILATGCSKDVTEDGLIGGHWVATAGYTDEEIEGEPLCPPYDEGMVFNKEGIVYVDTYEEGFKYRLRESDDGFVVEFYRPNGVLDTYDIKMISEDEMALVGRSLQEKESCYLERK